jgi:hypothetical protein
LKAEPKYRLLFKKLAEPQYAQILIGILKSSIQNITNDLTLYYTLDLLWTFSGNFLFNLVLNFIKFLLKIINFQINFKTKKRVQQNGAAISSLKIV